MQEGFIKYGKNEVVQISQITTIWASSKEVRFITTDYTQGVSSYAVEPEYEQEWRYRFDLND